MEQRGLVKSVDNNIAKIAFIKKSGCGGACSTCKSGCPQEVIVLDVKNTLDAKAGDEVEVCVTNKDFSKMTFWAYVFPTILTLLFFVVFYIIFKALNIKAYEIIAAVLGVVGMIVAFKIGGTIDKKKNRKYEFQMVKVIR